MGAGPKLLHTLGVENAMMPFGYPKALNLKALYCTRGPKRTTTLDNPEDMSLGGYLEGQGDLVSRLVTPITHIVTPVIPIINLLTKSP